MQRINVGFWYQLGAAARPLLELKVESSIFDVFNTSFSARQWVDAVVAGRILRPATGYSAATRLRDALNELINSTDFSADPLPANAPPTHIFAITEAAREFDTVYLAELQLADAYVVSSKGTYSTAGLIFSADAGFIGDDVQAGLPETARDEIRQWGRCFAFELPTAAGFHIMRATEIVILEYLEKVSGKPVKVSPRTWNAYIKALEKAGASEAITSSLHQIRKLHRNPLMHPDDTLSISKADALFGLAKAAIIAMITPETLS